jgi:hypothetical protein
MDKRWWLILAASVLLPACGQQAGAGVLLPSKVEAPQPKRLTCTFTLSTDVKAFPHGTVVKAHIGEGCPEGDLPAWVMLSDPNGVTYTLHDTHAGLLADIPGAAPGHGKYLHLRTWILGQRLRFEAELGGTAVEVMLAPGGAAR